MSNRQNHDTEAEEKPIPETGHRIVDAAVAAATRVAGLGAQSMNNLILMSLAVVLGFLIYVDRRDRQEQNGMQLRSFENQGELNRQSISNNTTAIQSLTVTVGKLDTAVTELRREVTGAKKFP